MAGVPQTPTKAKNEDVELLFQKMGEKLGWFQHKDVNTALKSITKSAKKNSKSKGHDTKSKEDGEKGKSKKSKKKLEKSESDSQGHSLDSLTGGYPLKPSRASTDLTRDHSNLRNRSSDQKAVSSEGSSFTATEVGADPDQKMMRGLDEEDDKENIESRCRLSADRPETFNTDEKLGRSRDKFRTSYEFADMPSVLEDIGAPLVESTRIHSRESISFYKLQDSILSSENNSAPSFDQSLLDNLKINSEGAYVSQEKTLIRIRNSLPSDDWKRTEKGDMSENYFSVIDESVQGEEKEQYYSVLEESPLGSESKEDDISKGLTSSKTNDLSSLKNAKVNEELMSVCKQTVDTNVGTSLKSARTDQERMKYRDTGCTSVGVNPTSSASYCGGSADFSETSAKGQVADCSSNVKVLKHEEQVDESSSDADDQSAEAEGKLKVSDLCRRLEALTHSTATDDHDSDSDGEKILGKLSAGNSKEADTQPFQRATESEDLLSDEADCSYYEVADACVQTELDVSLSENTPKSGTEREDSHRTPSSNRPSSISSTPRLASDRPSSISSTPRLASDRPSSISSTPRLASDRPSSISSTPRLASDKPSSISSTPRLAELESAVYEKLRNSIKKFSNSPHVVRSAEFFDTVLKKVNLFGPKSNSPSQQKQDQVTLHKTETVPEQLNCRQSRIERKENDERPVEIKFGASKPKLKSCDGTGGNRESEYFKNKKSQRHAESSPDSPDGCDVTSRERIADLKSKSGKSFDNCYPQVRNSLHEYQKDEPLLHTDGALTEREVHEQPLGEENELSNTRPSKLTNLPFSTTPLCSNVSAETSNRRLKLSLKKSRPPKQASPSSESSVASSLSDEQKRLYRTGFSSPDYSDDPPVARKLLPDAASFSNGKQDKRQENVTVPDSPSSVNEDVETQNIKSFGSDENDIPDSVSEGDTESFHSVNLPDSQEEIKSKPLQSAGLSGKEHCGLFSESDSSSDERAQVKSSRSNARSVSWSKQTDSDSDSDEGLCPESDRYCITVSNSTWRSRKAESDSSEEDDLESFFEKMKATKKKKKISSSTNSSGSDSLDDFIVNDSEVESESDEDIFYLKTDNAKDKQPRIPRYVSSSDENSVDDEEISDSTSKDDDVPRQKIPRKKVKKTDKEQLMVKKDNRKFETPKAQIMSASHFPSSTKSSTVKICSFLRSLTEDLEAHRRHPDACRYVKYFKKNKEELTQKLFRLYNETIFDSKLPSEMVIEWNKRLLKTAGFCKYMKNHTAKVELSDKVCDTAERVRDTLIHELCHAACWMLNHKNDGHGPYWKYWARKANQMYSELPVISRCHNYAIFTKYTYKCVRCGYSIGRHSKSLDTDRKVCGKCHGRFELQLSANSNSSSVSHTPKTPRTPNRFALFVKENYGGIKKGNNSLSHKDIMRVLSQEFALKNKIAD